MKGSFLHKTCSRISESEHSSNNKWQLSSSISQGWKVSMTHSAGAIHVVRGKMPAPRYCLSRVFLRGRRSCSKGTRGKWKDVPFPLKHKDLQKTLTALEEGSWGSKAGRLSDPQGVKKISKEDLKEAKCNLSSHVHVKVLPHKLKGLTRDPWPNSSKPILKIHEPRKM